MDSIRESALEEIEGQLLLAFEGADVNLVRGEEDMDAITVSNLSLETQDVRFTIFSILEAGSFVALRNIFRDQSTNDLWNMDCMLHSGIDESSMQVMGTITYLKGDARLKIALQWYKPMQ